MAPLVSAQDHFVLTRSTRAGSTGGQQDGNGVAVRLTESN